MEKHTEMNQNESNKLQDSIKFNFEFNLNEVYLLGVALSKLPYENVKDIIEYIQNNLAIQLAELQQNKTN